MRSSNPAPALPSQPLAPKPLCYYNQYEPIETFEMRTKGYDHMFNPFSNAWIKKNTPQFLRERFYKQPMNANAQKEAVVQQDTGISDAKAPYTKPL